MVTIAHAIATNDTSSLARAIDEAEHHQLVAHAARMRIILAARSHDPRPLAQGRPVLERLGARQFLRRLAEIEQEIHN